MERESGREEEIKKPIRSGRFFYFSTLFEFFAPSGGMGCQILE